MRTHHCPTWLPRRDPGCRRRPRTLQGAHRQVPHLPLLSRLSARFACRKARHYASALSAHPGYRSLVYDYAEALLANRQADVALRLLEQQLAQAPLDDRIYALQAKCYASLGKRLLQHQAQAEAYLRRGYYGAAMEQLQLALRAGDGDFYQLSATEARLRELRARLKEVEKRAP